MTPPFVAHASVRNTPKPAAASAQAQAKPGGNQQTGSLADKNCGNQHQEQAEAAPQPVRDAERQADECQQREEGVDADFDAHPTAQRD